MKFITVLFIPGILLFTCCNKPEVNAPDVRDGLPGTYKTSSYTESAQFSPLPTYDSLVYNTDTVYLTVTKSQANQTDIIVNNDTLSYQSRTSSTIRFSKGIENKTHYADFKNDSLWYIVEDTATATQYRAHGWIGPKQ